MSTGQYLHVCQFFQTVFTFSILFLVGQKFFIIFRKFDEKYAEQKNKQYQLEMKWYMGINDNKNKPSAVQQIDQQKRKQLQRNAIEQARRNLEQQRLKEKSLHQNNLKQSLVNNQNQTTDRRLENRNQQENLQMKRSGQKRKSLTQLSNHRNSQQVQIKDQQSVKDNQQKKHQKAEQNREQNKIDDFGKFELNNQRQQDKYQQSIHPSQFGVQEQVSRQQMSARKYIGYFLKIDNAFDEYVPILMSTIVLGMLTQSTLVFSMVCFFGYFFASLLLNYADLLATIKNKTQKQSIFSKIQRFISGIFIIALFIDYWIDSQFNWA